MALSNTIEKFVRNNSLGLAGAFALLGAKLFYDGIQEIKRANIVYDPKIVYVFDFPPTPGLKVPSGSPFVLKVICFLQYHKIPYEIIYTTDLGPRGKHPRAYIDGKLVCDSHYIIETLQKKFNIIDDVSDASSLAQMSLIRRFMDDAYVYNNLLYPRWVDPTTSPKILDVMFAGLPAFLFYVKGMVARKVSRNVYIQGTSRYSPDEIYEMSFTDLSSLSTLLGEKRFFFGTEKLTYGDITIFSHLAQQCFVEIDNPPRSLFLKQPNLVRFTKEVKSLIFGDDDNECWIAYLIPSPSTKWCSSVNLIKKLWFILLKMKKDVKIFLFQTFQLKFLSSSITPTRHKDLQQ
eukprot:gene4168-5217_t